MKKTALSVLLALLLSPVLLHAQHPGSDRGSFMIAPYAGRLEHSYRNETYSLDMNDSGAMYGLFSQYANSWIIGNVFGWYSPDVNDARAMGLHANLNLRTPPVANTCVVLGAIYENIDIRLKSRELSGTPVNDFTMHTDVTDFLGRLESRS